MRLAGFSLIELMIVISLWVIALTLVGVSTQFMHKIVARNEIDLLHATCCNLQQRAVSIQKEQALTFNELDHSYEYDGHVHHLPKSVQFGILPGVQGPPSASTHALHSPITFANKTITFHPDGIIQPGTVYLRDMPGGQLYALSSGISPVSFLRKYRYEKTWLLIE